MNGLCDSEPDRNRVRRKIMGLGEKAGRKSYFPQLQERIRELEASQAYLQAKSAELAAALEALDVAYRQAEKSERRFRDLAELLPQTVFETNPLGQVTFANREAYAVFGYRPADVERGLDSLAVLVPEDRERARADLARIMQGEDLGGRQYTALRSDGSTFPCLVYATAIHGDSGEVLGIRGIVIDISEQVRLREQKEQIEAQYHQAQKMEAVGRLAGGVAHDFNNLLCPILGYAEMLLEACSADETLRKPLDAIHTAALRARDVVRQLLAFSRKQTLEVKVVDLNRVITAFESLLRRMIRENVAIGLSLSSRPLPVRADVGQIEQVIMNLMVNAQDAIPGEGRIRISTDLSELPAEDPVQWPGVPAGRYARLTLSDTGQGMDAATRERIFDPFFTTKEKGKGTGLGLATVYGIVKQYEGHLQVTSEPGAGSAFSLLFPLAKGIPEKVEKPSPAVAPLCGGETLLVAEDSDLVRELTVEILKREGYRVFACSSGAACLTLLNTHQGPCHLLVTDVILPDMNGRVLAREVVARQPDIRVLYISGYTENEIVAPGGLEKGTAFLQKPFTVQDLVAKVREVLER